MGFFTIKKKTAEPVSGFKMINEIKIPLLSFGDNITKSDVVMICIDKVQVNVPS